MKRSLACVLSVSVSAAIVSSGCSFVMTTGPGAVGNPPQAYPDCTESLTWPVVDGIIGASMLLSAIGVLGATHNSDSSNTEDAGTGATVSAVLFAAAFGAGAYVGYGRTSRCSDVRQEFLASHPNGMQPSYGGGGYPPAGGGYGNASIGSRGGLCTQGNGCDPGLVCSGMPDHSNRCIIASAPPPQGPVSPPPGPVSPPPGPPAVGTQNGACTQQLTCNAGLVCSGMPDRTNKCIAAPQVGALGGSCTAQLSCNQGLVCSGMPDHTNKCISIPVSR